MSNRIRRQALGCAQLLQRNLSEHIKSETNHEVRRKIAVFGGSGYVGQHIVAAAVGCGVDVVSINRRGSPPSTSQQQYGDIKVEWRCGDLLGDQTQWAPALEGVHGAISCVGAFGSNEFMERVNGDANINAIRAALDAKVPHFVFISTTENNLPPFLLRGYFNGKRRAERALLDAFPTVTRNGEEIISSGTVLRPGFIYGEREIVDGVKMPLHLIGKPLEALFKITPIPLLRDRVPGMQAILAPPVDVHRVARVAVACALGDCVNPKEVLSINDINDTYTNLN